jgi:purine-cytosine permease-like protein
MPEQDPPPDRFGTIEQHGIDRVPDSERHGKASDLFVVWAASNTIYIYIVVGGALPLLGLNIIQGLCAAVLGNLFWALVGLLAASGATSGTPGSIVMRAMFGVRANPVNLFISVWIIAVAYEAINLSIGALASFALIEQCGLHVGIAIKLAVVIITAAVTLTISVYGHGTIARLSGPFTIMLAAGFAVLAVFVVQHANFANPLAHAAVSAAPHGAALCAAMLAGVTIVASGPLSWSTSGDYARYLPASTPAASIALWTGLGGFLPSVALNFIGMLAGTAVDMNDPQNAFRTIVPAWFYPGFLLLIAASSVTNNVLNAYSSGLSLQAMGVRTGRTTTVLWDGAIAVALTIYALVISNFLETLSAVLSLSVSLLGPSLAIFGTDLLRRRNCYDGNELLDETPASPYWFDGGVRWAGVIAQSSGTAAALLCVNTAVLVGPVATWLGGADLSTIVGPLVGAGVYAVMARAPAAQATARHERLPVPDTPTPHSPPPAR